MFMQIVTFKTLIDENMEKWLKNAPEGINESLNSMGFLIEIFDKIYYEWFWPYEEEEGINNQNKKKLYDLILNKIDSIKEGKK